MTPLTREQIAGLRELLAKATPGEWMLATSCSWWRILTAGGKPVIVPTIQRSDNHPDMDCGQDYVNAELAIAAVNALPALLDSVEADTALRAALVDLAGRCDVFRPDSHIGPLHGAGMAFAYTDIAKALRTLAGEAK